MIKMFPTCVGDTLERISVVEKHPNESYSLRWYQNRKMYQAQLRLYRMFLWCNIPDCDANLLADIDFIASSIAQLYKPIENETDYSDVTQAEENLLIERVNEKCRDCRAELVKDHYRQHLIALFSVQAECFTRNNDETVEFLDCVHDILNDLVQYTDKNVHSYLFDRIQSLVESAILLRNLVYFTDPQQTCGLNNFRFFVHDWANKAASLSVLHGLVGIPNKTSRCLHNDLQQIVNPCNPEFIKLCFKVVKVAKMKPEDRLLFGEFVSRFVDFFLENLVFVLNDDDVRLVREGLIFVLTFLADPPTMHSELLPLVREQIYAVFDQASDYMCFFCETNLELEFSKGKMILEDFLKSIVEVRSDIVNLYVHIPPSSWSNFPMISRLVYFECLLACLENLEETMNQDRKLVPFLRHPILAIQGELLALKSFLRADTLTIQYWNQIMSLLYEADFAIKSSFIVDDPIWYNLSCLSFVLTKIKDIRYKVMNFQIETQTKRSNIPETVAIDVPKPQTFTSDVVAVVGFEKETDLLIDRLTSGSERLDIVSIVGMGGIGKTTLANKLYNTPLVKHHFHKHAFCSVSQDYRKTNVLLGILSDVSQIDDSIRQMSDDDLAQRLRQSLLGSRYLIVLDDIWDFNVWDDLKASFPDSKVNKGSRVIFTTRNNTISLKAAPASTPCLLPFLSDDESWELLQQIIFHKDPCPEHLLRVGELIAKKCKGLPLAIVVIAGLLASKERSFPSWNEIEKTLNSVTSIEVCRDVIELSYTQLPEALKSCFLYLGVFTEHCTYSRPSLTKFWVAEGFVLKSGNSSEHEIAKKYLNELSERNLITVTQRSLKGGIKRYRVHDLIRDFCRIEARKEHYMRCINEHNEDLSMSGVYRICIEAEWRSFLDAKPRGRTVHSLLYFEDSPYFVAKASVEVNAIQSFLCNFKLVQVLDLLDIVIDGGFPMTITTLVHLRYLALRFSAAVSVPPEIINLWNLNTLMLWACEYSGVHISGNGDWMTNSGAMEAAYIKENRYIVDLPNNIWKMKRLRHVELKAVANVVLGDVTGVYPLLPDLISFGSLYVVKGEDGLELLRRLSHVKKFSCDCSGWWDPNLEKYQLPKLETLTKLESLSMVHKGKPCPPYLFSFPSTLKKLTLEDFGVPWNEFSAIIGMLPCLEVLDLRHNSFNGKTWDMEDDEQFPTIEYLKLDNLDIEEWNASVDSFPNLVKLVVFSCLKLIDIPSCFSDVVTLMSIHVDACTKSVADSATEIQNDQFDSGNDGFEVVLRGIRT